MSHLPKCRQCNSEMLTSSLSRRYCDWRCKRLWQANNKGNAAEGVCRQCNKPFPKGPGQHAKAICSAECRRARLAESVRTFHIRKPTAQAVYRQAQRQKKLPDGNLIRFYSWNPTAPRKCESCGEHRVLTIAHKPEYARFGSHRARANCVWPRMVWVLCPTCHALLDRMNYPPSELGLTV